MGPLKGIKIIEVGGIGPGPFCAMMLADMGAEILRIERKGQYPGPVEPKYNVWHRNRRSVLIDLKKPEGREVLLKLIEQADALIEGFRPGVMEGLGLGPDICFKRNPKLIFGRMTGWGQDGPLALAAGHDINYIALTGALYAIGRPKENPIPPLNLVGDLGGGGMLLAFGILCALLEAKHSGQGQIVDAAMVDGAALLMGIFYAMRAAGTWSDERGMNILDGGAHFYNTYETLDGKWISIGSIEPQFYKLLLELTEIEDLDFDAQMDRKKWIALKKKLAVVFKAKTRNEWCRIMEGTDVCFAPVLSLEEAPHHPHNLHRKTFVQYDGWLQPAPAPRFSRTPPELQTPPPMPGEHTESALLDWGFMMNEIDSIKKGGVIGTN